MAQLYDIYRVSSGTQIPIDDHKTLGESISFMKEVGEKVDATHQIMGDIVSIQFADPSNGQQVTLVAQPQ